MMNAAGNERGVDNNIEGAFDVILQSAIKGDERAFRQIYNMLSGKMYSLCIRYGGNVNDANDLFQEGIIRIYKNLSGYNASGSFEGWARRIFVNVCLDHIKRKQKLLFAEVSDNAQLPSGDLNGLDKLSKTDLLNTIQQLPAGYRLIVNLYLVEGYSHKEIADILAISEGTSKSQLSRAKVVLQKNITAFAGA